MIRGNMSTIVMKQRVCRSRDLFVAAIFVLAVPSIALAVDGIICRPVPPGGSIQLKVRIHGPSPIIVDRLGPDIGAVQGVTLLGAPNTAGTAVFAATHWSSARRRPPPRRGFLPTR